jgi:aspartyl-tRNA(Asn)/glutamyl-tRNA(Gln) amidotransferase subunit B
LPFTVDKATVKRVKGELPMLPKERRRKYKLEYGIAETDARILTSRPELAVFFERAAAFTAYPKIAANMIVCDLLALVDSDGFDCPIKAECISELATLWGEERINSSTAKRIIKLLAAGDTRSPTELVSCLGLEQINDRARISCVLFEVIDENPKLIADYTGGKSAAKKAIVGKVMAKTAGLANPVILNEIFEKMLDGKI